LARPVHLKQIRTYTEQLHPCLFKTAAQTCMLDLRQTRDWRETWDK